jgi:hypothetical protein
VRRVKKKERKEGKEKAKRTMTFFFLLVFIRLSVWCHMDTITTFGFVLCKSVVTERLWFWMIPPKKRGGSPYRGSSGTLIR